MEVNADFEAFESNMDEFFTYPNTTSIMDEYTESPTFDLPNWQPRNYSEDLDHYTSVPPSLSRSSSLPSDTIDSPMSGSPVLAPTRDSVAEMKLTWPTDGQLQFQEPITEKAFSSHHEKGHPVSPSASSPDSSVADPHHEGSCAKCRMTEAEARRCRLERRREQNRASQRKFRARKEAKIREAASQVATLETYVEFLEKHNGDLEKTNAELRQQIADMEKSSEPRSSAKSNSTMQRPLITTSQLQPITSSRLGRPTKSNTWSQPFKSGANNMYLPLFDHELQPQHSNSAR
ncbi:hypothetical protein H2198_009727 [Neophaeococcomyces mojaviensis]|uniref:Uncharacterized protein n=1 Tax=Neophaeococcomyces mojaviensis TaxID=3383035 RepID=A0ACC2ZTS6_9EURO|nr:hypothetical protein H2198_009727 [Knufia sp. JES_112]